MHKTKHLKPYNTFKCVFNCRCSRNNRASNKKFWQNEYARMGVPLQRRSSNLNSKSSAPYHQQLAVTDAQFVDGCNSFDNACDMTKKTHKNGTKSTIRRRLQREVQLFRRHPGLEQNPSAFRRPWYRTMTHLTAKRATLSRQSCPTFCSETLAPDEN